MNLSDYLNKIKEKTPDGTYAFRGQENIDWPLVSSATRRLFNYYKKRELNTTEDLNTIPNFQRCYIDYHQDVLIDPARTNGFGIEKGRDLSDLEILAKFQHFGAATGLLDFTRNRTIALWFACQNDKHDGKVFIINTTAPNKDFVNITYEKTKEKITEILLKKTLFVWEPIALGEPMVRIIRQHSLFIIETSQPISSEVVNSVKIDKKDKKNILQEIKENFDIDESSIFKDFYGFTTINQSDSDIPIFRSFSNYFELGNIAYQRKEHNEAIRYYSKAIALKDVCLEAYYNRGNSYAAGKNYESAIEDYTFVINYLEIKGTKVGISWLSSLYIFYFNRANSYSNLRKHTEAIKDYDQSLKKCRTFEKNIGIEGKISPYICYNQGNSFHFLGKYQKAIEAYEKRIENHKRHIDAWFNKGNSEVLLFQFDKAEESYSRALQINPNKEYVKLNFECVKSIIQSSNPKEGQTYHFSGNRKNIGMFSGMSTLTDNYGFPKFGLDRIHDGFEDYKDFDLIYLKGRWKKK